MRASLPATSPGALGANSGVVRSRPADPMSPFDRSLALRVVGVVFVTAALAAVVIVATDEAGSTAPMRVARLCALQPALAALGCWAVQAQAEARGELRALLGLGASPWRLCRGPCVAAWGLGALALVTLASPWADPSSLFPVVAPAAWERVGGQLVDPVHGVSVDARGALRFLGQSARGVAQGPGAAAACWALAPLAAIVPVWIGAPARASVRAGTGLLSVGVVLVLLHAVAAIQIAPEWLAAAALPLAAQALAGYLKH